MVKREVKVVFDSGAGYRQYLRKVSTLYTN